jgi:hypothetical protein
MTKEQITIDDTNEIVAIFDGWELASENNVGAFWKNGYHLYHYELDYHSDWSRLMGVIEKIDSLRVNGNIICQTNATSHTFYIHYNYPIQIIGMPTYNHGRLRAEGESRIWNVYLAIVDFIKWHNQLNKKNHENKMD